MFRSGIRGGSAVAKPERIGAYELTAAMVLSGTIGVFVVESQQSSFNVVFFRCLFGALALGAYCLLRGYFRDSGLTWGRLALAALGGFFIVYNWVFLFTSFTYTSISVGTVVYHTQPFYVMLLGALIFRERLTAQKVGWLLVAFVGLVMVTGLTLDDLRAGGDDRYVVGVGFALAAALFYAFATLIAKRLKEVRPHLVALIQVLVGIVLLLPFTQFGATAGLGMRWGWLIGLGVIHTCVMYILMYSSYQKLPPSKIAVLSFIYPAVAMLADFVVYGHHISLVQALGIPFIVGASLGISLGWRLWPARRTPAVDAPASEPDAERKAPAQASR
ncbi:DMT family transporter [Thermoactinospora rubra]|uniref:DMT family transporter n=1 Tax=Thermoactinospora rubra TaxID=1088767 RepID=UPI00197D8BB0|nr:DMT family transporter [Thermoactinospora rubra]